MRAPRGDVIVALLRTLALVVGFSLAFALIGIPSPALFGGLLGGMVQALGSRTSLELPPLAFRLAQLLVGAIIGTQVSSDALHGMVDAAVPILVVTMGTIALSIGGGLLLARRDDVSPVTGVCALIAGGAAGVVAVARELGADDRVVTVVQYLRVAAVLFTLPVVTGLVFHPEPVAGAASALVEVEVSWPRGLAYLALTMGIGLLLARLVPITTMVILGPMAIGAVLTNTGWLGEVAVPTPLQWLAYALLGVQVGLRFSRRSLAAIGAMLPAVVAIITGLVVSTGLMGLLLARFTDVDGLTAYLATTPGGLFAVLATAADSGADVTYVIALQLFRLLVILAIIPLLAKWLRGRAA